MFDSDPNRFREPLRAKRIREAGRLQARSERRCSLIHSFEKPGQGYDTWREIFAARRKWARKMRDNRVTCSGVCCGNPRRHFGDPTLQELRAEAVDLAD